MALIESDRQATIMLSHNIYAVPAKYCLAGPDDKSAISILTPGQEQKKARPLGPGSHWPVLIT